MSPAEIVLFTMKSSVILSVFALGLEASVQDVTHLWRHPRQLLLAFISIYLLVPLAAGLIIAGFSNIHPAAKIAIFALSISPIPPLLPKKQLKTGEKISYIIGLLVTISLLSIVVIPLLVELFSMAFQQEADVSPVIVARVVMTVILAPLAVGLTLRSVLPGLAAICAKPILTIGSLFLLVGSFFILYSSLPQIFTLIGNGTLLAILLFVLVALAIGHICGGSATSEREALAVSTASRHPGIALAIASINFPEQKLSLAAVILYLILSKVATLVYSQLTKRWCDQQA